MIFFGSFFLFVFKLSARNSEIKKKISDDVHWKVWTNIKTLYARNSIFKKGIPEFWKKNFGTALGCFNHCFFFIFRRRPTIVADIFTPTLSPPIIKKLPAASLHQFDDGPCYKIIDSLILKENFSCLKILIMQMLKKPLKLR